MQRSRNTPTRADVIARGLGELHDASPVTADDPDNLRELARLDGLVRWMRDVGVASLSTGGTGIVLGPPPPPKVEDRPPPPQLSEQDERKAQAARIREHALGRFGALR